MSEHEFLEKCSYSIDKELQQMIVYYKEEQLATIDYTNQLDKLRYCFDNEMIMEATALKSEIWLKMLEYEKQD